MIARILDYSLRQRMFILMATAILIAVSASKLSGQRPAQPVERIGYRQVGVDRLRGRLYRRPPGRGCPGWRSHTVRSAP